MSSYTLLSCEDCQATFTDSHAAPWDARRAAEDAGWSCVDGWDWCPSCAKSQDAEVADERGREYARGMEDRDD